MSLYDSKHYNSHEVTNSLCQRSESEYITDIQFSEFAVAVTLLAKHTEPMSDASMASGSEMNRGIFYGVTAPSVPGSPHY